MALNIDQYCKHVLANLTVEELALIETIETTSNYVLEEAEKLLINEIFGKEEEELCGVFNIDDIYSALLMVDNINTLNRNRKYGIYYELIDPDTPEFAIETYYCNTFKNKFADKLKW